MNLRLTGIGFRLNATRLARPIWRGLDIGAILNLENIQDEDSVSKKKTYR